MLKLLVIVVLAAAGNCDLERGKLVFAHVVRH
jgi:hypothetical protein